MERQCDHARPARACPGNGADLRRNIRGERHDQQAAKEEVGIACREGHQPQELKEDSSEAAGDHEARSLPIRLTPMTATCRVPPLSRVKLGIGWSRGAARDAEQ